MSCKAVRSRAVSGISRASTRVSSFTFARAGLRSSFGRQPIVNIFSRAAIFHHARALELREMTRDARLAHAENFLQLRHRKLLFLEEQEQAEPGRVGEQPEKING